MQSGNFVLVLHTHLPWVLHHGTGPHGVDWLNEAVAECYIPLLNKFHELLKENIFPKVTIDISPVLCEQLSHPDFIEIFKKYCDEKISWAKIDEKRFRDWGYDAHQVYLAQYWQEWYNDRKNNFIFNYNSSITNSLKELQDIGAIEIATCGATHGYLPLLPSERSINLQIEAAINNYKKHFGREPRGIWLPECAYRPSYEWKSLLPIEPFHHSRLRPGIEQFLAKFGIEYFFTDQDLTNRANPIGVFIDVKKDRFVHKDSAEFKPMPGTFKDLILKPFLVSSSEKVEYGTSAVFTRHQKIAMQVWSGEAGYPGEPDYLDFHKKHYGSMLRYWRVTDNKADMMYKTLYHPDWTKDKIDLQANHFIHHIENTLNHYHNTTGNFGTLCTPFDTELFGHWWFEGPEFLQAVIRGLHHSPYVKTATASEQLIRINPTEVLHLPEGSWGENNNHDVWSNEGNKWTWEVIYNNENRLREIYEKFSICSLDEAVNIHGQSQQNKLSELSLRIIKQALREFMLLDSSDWQFLIHTQSAKDYAEQRFLFHNSDFNKLCELAMKYKDKELLEEKDRNYLEETEKRNSIFPELQLVWWRE
jgi:1,4-alpha-glucan branching enzyme